LAAQNSPKEISNTPAYKKGKLGGEKTKSKTQMLQFKEKDVLKKTSVTNQVKMPLPQI